MHTIHRFRSTLWHKPFHNQSLNFCTPNTLFPRNVATVAASIGLLLASLASVCAEEISGVTDYFQATRTPSLFGNVGRAADANIPLGKAHKIEATVTESATNSVFAQVFQPFGVATDASGGVFVSSCDDGCFNSIVSKFAPDGTALGAVAIGDGITTAGQYLATDPATGAIYDLIPDGTLLAIDPNSGAITPLLNLRQLQIDTSSVYDIVAGAADNFGGLILPESSIYGDLSILQSSDVTYLFVTALSAQTLPYVIRLRLQGGSVVEAKAIVASRASTAGGVNLTRGVAVNLQKVVLTTLPIGNGVGTFDVPVAFIADFDPMAASVETIAVSGGTDLASSGMTADTAGNFYIATNSVGSAALGLPGGSLVVVSPEFLILNTFSIGGATSTAGDVAVSSLDGTAYLTARNENAVIAVSGLLSSEMANSARSTNRQKRRLSPSR
ncbi:hypothetical protein [Gloeobacter morelensis]|uniref:NHL repeat containing protein n=1 Tax=Gloeobacter morelensis MG652769 TaxID=2781736 RepID=A0ABY3PKZ5_9CYAN|nr:hypothetical protein [Gloeobacter morelensis]UFP94352.1 hypothetical protein ISF26_21830 [Gloeobacter morelensis MG652769]